MTALATQPHTTARPRSQPGPGIPSDPSSLIARMPPHDLDAEAAFLGSILIDPQTMEVGHALGLKPASFFKEDNGVIYQVICELEQSRSQIDAMVVHSALKSRNLLDQIGGVDYLQQLANAVPTSAHATTYAAMIMQTWKKRDLIRAATQTLKDCYESNEHEGILIERAMARVFKVSETSISNHPLPMSEILPAYIEKLDQQHRAGALPGLPTGLTRIDALTGGLQNGEVILVAARPGCGKTSFAMSVIEYVSIVLREPCAMFSLEMSKDAIALRVLSSQSRVDSQKIRKHDLSGEDKANLAYAVGPAASDRMFIDDTPKIRMQELRSKAIRLKQKYGIKLLAIDYLGLMGTEGGENRNNEVGNLSVGVKALARELNIPILLLSQLNRKCDDERRPPRSSDLRDSGNLEQDADVIILLHREWRLHQNDDQWKEAHPEEKNRAEAIIDKQRNGAIDTIPLLYYPWCTRFQDLPE